MHDRWTAIRSPGLAGALAALWPDDASVAEGYSSELNLRLAPWLRAVAERMQRGYLLLIDYGYSRDEYYHPQRSQGTLICHFRHRAHADPYLLPGLQDITANVDFSALATAASDAGFSLAGFTTQAHFLIDSGLQELLAASDPADVKRHFERMQGVKKLTLPSEMGERFKVMALARDAPPVLSGFRSKDLRGRL
jgi:SAM-dependent MidA family methyltransferase